MTPPFEVDLPQKLRTAEKQTSIHLKKKKKKKIASYFLTSKKT